SNPYIEDRLSKTHHLRCGNAAVHRVRGLEVLTNSDLVLVLDMGQYYWSGTLKDPRSWAIINTALAHKITELVLWTAGNAAISLAKLAQSVNRRLPPKERIQIHAIVNESVPSEIRTRLRLWQCKVINKSPHENSVLNVDQIQD